jgi:hypothetical protein
MIKQAGPNIGFIRATGLKLAEPEPTGYWKTIVKEFKKAYQLTKYPKPPVGFNAHVTQVKTFKK